MTREEKLQRLQAIDICAQPTVITYDMGLEYIVMTSTGAGTGFGDMGQWPCFRFHIDDALRAVLVRRDIGETITIEDIKDLQFAKVLCSSHNPIEGSYPFADDVASKIQKVLIRDLALIKSDAADFYAFQIWDGIEHDPILCATLEDMKQEFLGYYSWLCSDYEDMSDDELDYWFDFVEEQGEGLAKASYGFRKEYEEEDDE